MKKRKTYRIGRFRIKRLMYSGDQSSVFLALDTILDREVVIKVLKNRSIKENDQAAETIKEARAVSRLQHPNIIFLYEVGEENNTPYLVFEYVEGLTLREIIRKKKPLSINNAVKIMSQILDGISHAHKQGIIHKDLKPENIMISSEGVPRVMDFGISQIINDDNQANHLQKGTLHYMAPEYFSDGIISESTDVFSLGLILYEMLTFTPCIEAENEFALIYKIIYEPSVLPSLVNSSIASALDNIFAKAVQKDPKSRFHDAGSMKEAIDFYLESFENKTTSISVQNNTDGIINFLLRRMKHKSDFPAFSKSVIDINEKTSKDPNTSAKDLANIILKDYSLTNKLLKIVNSAYYGGSGKGVTTIRQAIVLLGLEQVRMTAASMLVFTQIRNKSNVGELKDLMIKSFMSGLIEVEISNHMNMPKTEIGFLCAMFQNLGRNLTVYYFPEEYSDIVALMEEKGMGMQNAAHEVLGVSFDELGVCVARQWKFPEAIIYGMRGLPECIVEKPKTKLEKIRHFSVFANELCELAGNMGPEQSGDQLEALLNRFAPSISISKKDIFKILLISIERMKQYTTILDINTEKSHFIQSILKLTETEENEKFIGRESLNLDDLSPGQKEHENENNHGSKAGNESEHIVGTENIPQKKPIAFYKKLMQIFFKSASLKSLDSRNQPLNDL